MEAGGGEWAVGVCAGDVDKDDENMKIEVEAGRRRPDRMAAPEEPTEQERVEHMFTHMPLRSWCRHCFRGRSKEELCRQGQGHPEHPEVHMDNLLMGKETGGNTLAVLVAKDRSSRALISTVVARKRTGEFVSKRVVTFMREVGCEKSVVTLKTDNEPMLKAVADVVAKVRANRGAQRTIMENSAAYFFREQRSD